MSVGYDTDNTTYTNNLIYEGLYDPYGDGSDHNYCTLVGDGADHVALLGNVWSKARNRIPRLKSETRSVVVNNFTYFFDEASTTDSSAETTWVGTDTPASWPPVNPSWRGVESCIPRITRRRTHNSIRTSPSSNRAR